jgi:hypothetical protein
MGPNKGRVVVPYREIARTPGEEASGETIDTI